MQAKSNYLYLLRLSYNSHCSDGWSLQYGEAQPQDVSAHDEDEGGGAGGDCGGPDGRGAVQCKKSLVVCWISEVCRYENLFFFLSFWPLTVTLAIILNLCSYSTTGAKMMSNS